MLIGLMWKGIFCNCIMSLQKSQENVDNMQIISKKVQRVPVLWMCTIMNDIICCIKISKEKLVIK